MFSANLRSYNDQGLKDYTQRLNDITANAGVYEQLLLSDVGKLLLRDLKVEHEFIKNVYGNLIPDAEGIGIALADVQAQERLLKHWIRRIENSPALLNSLAEAQKSVVAELEQRRKRSTGSTFVTSARKQEMIDETQG